MSFAVSARMVAHVLKSEQHRDIRNALKSRALPHWRYNEVEEFSLDALTQSIVGKLESCGIPFDKALLAHRIDGLTCQYHPSALEIVACDGATIFVKVFDMLQQVDVASGEVIATHPTTELTASPASPEATESAPAVDPTQEREDDEAKSARERRAALREAIERAEKEAVRLGDPANVRLPRLEEDGYSWSLFL